VALKLGARQENLNMEAEKYQDVMISE